MLGGFAPTCLAASPSRVTSLQGAGRLRGNVLGGFASKVLGGFAATCWAASLQRARRLRLQRAWWLRLTGCWATSRQGASRLRCKVLGGFAATCWRLRSNVLTASLQGASWLRLQGAWRFPKHAWIRGWGWMLRFIVFSAFAPRCLARSAAVLVASAATSSRLLAAVWTASGSSSLSARPVRDCRDVSATPC